MVDLANVQDVLSAGWYGGAYLADFKTKTGLE
jgi:hypothetical protein